MVVYLISGIDRVPYATYKTAGALAGEESHVAIHACLRPGSQGHPALRGFLHRTNVITSIRLLG